MKKPRGRKPSKEKEILLAGNNLIALCGAPGAGKDFVGTILREKFNYSTTAFAESLKKITRELLGREIDKSIDRDLLVEVGQYFRGEDNKLDKRFEKDTEKLFKLTAFLWERREVHESFWTEDFWAAETFNRIKRQSDNSATKHYINKNNKWVITDLRFSSEEKMVRENGGVIIRVESSKSEMKRRLSQRDGGYPDDVFENAGEKYLKSIKHDFVIRNIDSSKEDIIKQLKEILV